MKIRILTALVLLLATSFALAGEGRIPVYDPAAPLANPGKYVLTRNLPGAALQILSSEVELDLNGFVLDGAGAAVRVIEAIGLKNVVIKNGTIVSGDVGVFLESCENVRVENVMLIGQNISGIELVRTTNFDVSENTLTGAGVVGIRVDAAGVGIVQGHLRNNRLHDMTRGFELRELGSSVIEGNVVQSIGGDGLSCDSSAGLLFRRNTVRETGQNGMRMGGCSSSRFEHNVIADAVLVGMRFDAGSVDNTLLQNAVTASGEHGIVIEGERNVIRGNTMHVNGFAGLFFAPTANDNVISENSAQGNNFAGPVCGAPSTDFCDSGTPWVTNGDSFMPFAL